MYKNKTKQLNGKWKYVYSNQNEVPDIPGRHSVIQKLNALASNPKIELNNLWKIFHVAHTAQPPIYEVIYALSKHPTIEKKSKDEHVAAFKETVTNYPYPSKFLASLKKEKPSETSKHTIEEKPVTPAAISKFMVMLRQVLSGAGAIVSSHPTTKDKDNNMVFGADVKSNNVEILKIKVHQSTGIVDIQLIGPDFEQENYTINYYVSDSKTITEITKLVEGYQTGKPLELAPGSYQSPPEEAKTSGDEMSDGFINNVLMELKGFSSTIYSNVKASQLGMNYKITTPNIVLLSYFASKDNINISSGLFSSNFDAANKAFNVAKIIHSFNTTFIVDTINKIINIIKQKTKINLAFDGSYTSSGGYPQWSIYLNSSNILAFAVEGSVATISTSSTSKDFYNIDNVDELTNWIIENSPDIKAAKPQPVNYKDTVAKIVNSLVNSLKTNLKDIVFVESSPSKFRILTHYNGLELVKLTFYEDYLAIKTYATDPPILNATGPTTIHYNGNMESLYHKAVEVISKALVNPTNTPAPSAKAEETLNVVKIAKEVMDDVDIHFHDKEYDVKNTVLTGDHYSFQVATFKPFIISFLPASYGLIKVIVQEDAITHSQDYKPNELSYMRDFIVGKIEKYIQSKGGASHKHQEPEKPQSQYYLVVNISNKVVNLLSSYGAMYFISTINSPTYPNKYSSIIDFVGSTKMLYSKWRIRLTFDGNYIIIDLWQNANNQMEHEYTKTIEYSPYHLSDTSNEIKNIIVGQLENYYATISKEQKKPSSTPEKTSAPWASKPEFSPTYWNVKDNHPWVALLQVMNGVYNSVKNQMKTSIQTNLKGAATLTLTISDNNNNEPIAVLVAYKTLLNIYYSDASGTSMNYKPNASNTGSTVSGILAMLQNLQ